MAKNNHSIGNAGEFYLLAQLAQRGYIAGKADDGQTLIDVIATDPETLKTVNIQVKSTAQFTGYWMTGNKARKSFESLWYVFVSLKSPTEIPEFFVFHSAAVGAITALNRMMALGADQKGFRGHSNHQYRRF